MRFSTLILAGAFLLPIWQTNERPSEVTIIQPPAGSIVSGPEVPIILARTSEVAYSVVYLNGHRLTRLRGSAWFKWDTTEYPNGNYTITAIGHDDQGHFEGSDTDKVVVYNP